MPLPAKLEMVPPVALTSAELKSVEASERVKVSVALSPALRVLTSLEIAIVGATSSRSLISRSTSWSLALPAASVATTAKL